MHKILTQNSVWSLLVHMFKMENVLNMADNSKTCALNELFTQILNSEEKIRERFSKLRSINSAIQEAQIKIREAQNDLKSCRGNLLIKANRLADEEQKLKWQVIRENVLSDKRGELQTRNKHLLHELKNLEEHLETERATFISNVCKFLSFHDLTGTGKDNREREGVLRLNQISEEENLMKNELQTLKCHQRQLQAVRKNKDQLVEKEISLNKYYKGLISELAKEKHVTCSLDTDKMEASKRPHNDPEFRRLSAELEAARDGSMEGICEALAQELKELQQAHLRREMQKQRQQQSNQRGKGSTKRNTFQDQGRYWRCELNKKMATADKCNSDEYFPEDTSDQELIELSP